MVDELSKDVRDFNNPENFLKRSPEERREAAIYFLKAGAIGPLNARLNLARKMDSSFVLDLSGVELANACLWGANLMGVDLRGANLVCADLAGANLRNANLSGADLRGTVLAGANLTGADLTNALRGEAPEEYAWLGKFGSARKSTPKAKEPSIRAKTDLSSSVVVTGEEAFKKTAEEKGKEREQEEIDKKRKQAKEEEKKAQFEKQKKLKEKKILEKKLQAKRNAEAKKKQQKRNQQKKR